MDIIRVEIENCRIVFEQVIKQIRLNPYMGGLPCNGQLG